MGNYGKELLDENMELQDVISDLSYENRKLKQRICELEKENQELKKENNPSPFERYKFAKTIMEFYGDDIIEKMKGKE